MAHEETRDPVLPPKRSFWQRQKSFAVLLTAFGGVILLVLGGGFMMEYTERSEFCARCHVMEQSYEWWFHSGHRIGAGCSDCHLPHQNVAALVAGKVTSGLSHFYHYYAGRVDEPLRLGASQEKVVERNCLRCHRGVMEKVSFEDRNCWECHRGLPHGY